LRRLLRHDPGIEIVAIATGGAEAIEAANRLQPDLLFLDVEMPETDGFAVVRNLRTPVLPAIVFVTGNERGAIQAFEVAATDYLLKPCRLDRLKVALQRARTQLARRRLEALSSTASLPTPVLAAPAVTHLTTQLDGHSIILGLDEICWIENGTNQVTVHAGGQDYGVPDTLEQLHASLPAHRFFLASPSLLINLDQLRELRADAEHLPQAIFRDGSGHSLPVQSLHLLPRLVKAE
jgi:DNA-binding LytR/AlgR family response regulator